MSMRFGLRRALGDSATLAAVCAMAGALACEAPPPRDPPVGVSPVGVSRGTGAAQPPTANVDTFPARRDLPAAPRESLLGASARATNTRRRAARRAAPPRPDSARGVAPRPARGAGRRPCLVERVHDGDTIRCREGLSVRLLLIDAPELDQRPFGGRSQRQLAAMVPPGTNVTLETDAEPRDRYGRLLAYVYTSDGRMANEEMVRAGYAVVLVYKPNVRYEARFEAAAAEARAAGRGLYAEGGFSCPPREHRRKKC